MAVAVPISDVDVDTGWIYSNGNTYTDDIGNAFGVVSDADDETYMFIAQDSGGGNFLPWSSGGQMKLKLTAIAAAKTLQPSVDVILRMGSLEGSSCSAVCNIKNGAGTIIGTHTVTGIAGAVAAYPFSVSLSGVLTTAALVDWAIEIVPVNLLNSLDSLEYARAQVTYDFVVAATGSRKVNKEFDTMAGIKTRLSQ